MAKRACAEEGKIIRNTTIKIRLHPTPDQASLLDKTFGCCRYLWNRILSDQEEFYAATGVHFLPTPAKYKTEAPFLKEVDSSALANVHQNLRRAFQQFFADPAHFRHPVYKKKKHGKDSYTVYRSTQSANIYLTDSAVRLPKVGLVQANVYRRPRAGWDLRSVTVSKTLTGKYHCSLVFAYAEKTPETVLPAPEKTLGLNYSVSRFYVDSEGHAADAPHWLGQSLDRLSRMQRKLSRMRPDSRNYQEQVQKIRLLHEHIANQRKDFIHKESRRIANAWDAVCVRDSDLTAMSRSLPLGRVMDSGFGMFRSCLQYKLERLGKSYLVVDEYAPTAKTCHVCGFVNQNLTLRTCGWKCPVCGTVLSRERNAAQNIRDLGLRQLDLSPAAAASSPLRVDLSPAAAVSLPSRVG
jgi:putative transposase